MWNLYSPLQSFNFMDPLLAPHFHAFFCFILKIVALSVEGISWERERNLGFLDYWTGPFMASSSVSLSNSYKNLPHPLLDWKIASGPIRGEESPGAFCPSSTVRSWTALVSLKKVL